MKNEAISPEQRIILERYIKEIFNDNFISEELISEDLLSKLGTTSISVAKKLLFPAGLVGVAQGIEYSCADSTNWFCDMSDDLVATTVTAVLYAYGRRAVHKHGEVMPHIGFRRGTDGRRKLQTDITGSSSLLKIAGLAGGTISMATALALSWMYWMSPETYSGELDELSLGDLSVPKEEWDQNAKRFFWLFGVEQRKERDAFGMISTFLPWHRFYKGLNSLFTSEPATKTFFTVLKSGDDNLDSIVKRSSEEIEIKLRDAEKELADLGRVSDDIDGALAQLEDMRVLHTEKLDDLADGANGTVVERAIDDMGLRREFDAYWSELPAGLQGKLATKQDLIAVAEKAQRDFDTTGHLSAAEHWRSIGDEVGSSKVLKEAAELLKGKTLNLRNMSESFKDIEWKKMTALQKLWRGAISNKVPRGAFQYGDDLIRLLQQNKGTSIGEILVGKKQLSLKIVGVHSSNNRRIMVQLLNTERGAKETAVEWWKGVWESTTKAGGDLPLEGTGKITSLKGADWEGLGHIELGEIDSITNVQDEFVKNFKDYDMNIGNKFQLMRHGDEEALVAVINLDRISAMAGNTPKTNQMQVVFDTLGITTNVAATLFATDDDFDAGSGDPVKNEITPEEVVLLESVAEENGIPQEIMRKAINEAN